MNAAFCELLACPRCGGDLDAALRCMRCVCGYPSFGGIPDLRIDEDHGTRTVRLFYEDAPFPGYPPHDTLSALRVRAERSDFIQRLDRELPADARIVEIGCGTGQTSLFLARGDRIVIGADMTEASLRLANAAAQRYHLDGARFVAMDLRRPALKPESFDVVYCSGVLHHTQDPYQAFRAVAQLARHGGYVILGLYNFFARLPLRLRRAIARLTNYRVILFDPVLKSRAEEPERWRAWLRDQYQHPEEHSHTLREIQGWFAENGIRYLRSYPSAMFGEDEAPLFAPAADDWWLEGILRQMAWMRTCGGEGGLFVVFGQRALG